MKKFYSNPLLIVILMVFLFFLPNLLLGKIPMPADSLLGLYHPFRDKSLGGFNPGRFPTKNPLITDPVLQTYPWRKLTIDNIKRGELPLWNPYSFAGQPLAANVQSAPFQITNLLFFIMPFNLAWAIQVISPSILTAVFMYFFLKEINLSKTAAAFGAVVLPFTGFFIAWLTWGTVISTAMWLPLILLATEKLAKKISPIWFLILTFAASQVIFGGHLQTALYVLLASTLYLIFKFIVIKRTPFLITGVFAQLLAILLSSVQLLPTLEFINHSARDIDQSYSAARTDWFIPAQNLLQLVAPDFFGNPATYNYWGIWNYAEFVSFIGIIPLGLALFSFLTKSKNRNFFLALLLGSLILATANPIGKIPYVLGFPLIASLQPSRIIFLIVFSLVVLSCFGLDYFLNIKSKSKAVFLPSSILLIILVVLTATVLLPSIFPEVLNLDPRYIALRNLAIPLVFAAAATVLVFLKFLKIPNSAIIIIIFALSLAELFRFGHKFTPFAKMSWIFPETGITNFLAQQEKPFRIMTTDRRIMHPNISSVYGIESIDGYDPLYLSDYARFVSVLQSGKAQAQAAPFNRIVTPQNYTTNLTSLLGAEFILSFDTLSSPDLELVAKEGETKVYRNKKSLERAFFIDEVIKTGNVEEQYSKLLDPNFDLTKLATSDEFSFSSESKNSSLEISEYSDQNLTLITQSDAKRPLLVTNIFYPGWVAKVDSEKTDIYKANGIFQAVIVPEGQHRVEFKFRPQSIYNGLYVSALALILTSAGAFIIWRKRYQ